MRYIAGPCTNIDEHFHYYHKNLQKKIDVNNSDELQKIKREIICCFCMAKENFVCVGTKRIYVYTLETEFKKGGTCLYLLYDWVCVNMRRYTAKPP